MIFKLFRVTRLILRLGIINSSKALKHKIYVRLNIYELRYKIQQIPTPLISKEKKIKLVNEEIPIDKQCIDNANLILEGKFKLFNKKKINFGKYVNWHKDYVIKKEINNKYQHWSKIKLFDEIDIKRIWELSRWNWGPLLARSWIMTRDYRYLYKLNDLINNWCENNSANMGANWLDGQETAIRLIHALLTFRVIDQEKIPQYTFQKDLFIKLHIERLKQTYFYEQSQNNNHWISIAAGMFIGGGWLLKKSSKNREFGNKFVEIGRNQLEKSIKDLVLDDGTFSQYSTNYHRFVLDTLCQVEVWRNDLGLNPFSKSFYSSCKKLTNWYLSFIDSNSGKIANIGHNDGGLCYQLISKDYRDCRSTSHLSSYLFLKKSLDFSNEYQSINYWLNLKSNYKLLNFDYPVLKVFRKGGFGLIKPQKNSLGIIKFPNYIFRPSQADLLHFDLWYNGINIFKDGGTFSYNSSINNMNYFFGIDSHNTIKFDNQEPMKKFSRFLFIDWPKTKFISAKIIDKDSIAFCLMYEFKSGSHKRTIFSKNKGKKWEIIDEISNYKKLARLNWRLGKSNWQINHNEITSKDAKITISSSKNISSISLMQGWESEFYDHKNSLEVIEVILKESPASIKTVVELNE